MVAGVKDSDTTERLNNNAKNIEEVTEGLGVFKKDSPRMWQVEPEE